MALVFADRVKETSTTTGTGAYTLAGAATGFQSFAAIGDGNTCHYMATDGTDWEAGLGTYATAGTTLTRTTIYASSNAGAAVNWGAGTRTIGVTPIAKQSASPSFPEGLNSSSALNNGIQFDLTDTTGNAEFSGVRINYAASGADALSVTRYHRGMYIQTTGSATGGTDGQEHRLLGLELLTQASTYHDWVYGIRSIAESSYSGSIDRLIGVYGHSNTTGGGNHTAQWGGYFWAVTSSSGAPAQVIGCEGYAFINTGTTGVIPIATGVRGEVETVAGITGSVTTAYAFRAVIDDNDDCIANAYMFYGAGNAGTGNKWGVFINEDIPSRFLGRVEVGTASANDGLYVGGTAKASQSNIYIDTAAGQWRLLKFWTGGVERFSIGVNDTAESGSNAGSDLVVRRFNDAGNFQDMPFTIKRDTGITEIRNGLQVMTGAIGYGTGQGGQVTQTTSRTTAVTINKLCGKIQLFTEAGTSTYQTFTVNNSLVETDDQVLVSQDFGSDEYAAWATRVTAGSFQITFADLTGTASETVQFSFMVFRGKIA